MREYNATRKLFVSIYTRLLGYQKHTLQTSPPVRSHGDGRNIISAELLVSQYETAQTLFKLKCGAHNSFEAYILSSKEPTDFPRGFS